MSLTGWSPRWTGIAKRGPISTPIGVERAAGEAEGRGSSMRTVEGKKVIGAFNMFGKLDATKGGLTEGEVAVADAVGAAAKKVADLRGKLLGLPDTGKW